MNAANSMNRKATELSRQYNAALRSHVHKGPGRPSLQRAQGLGHQAMTIGLGTLDLARIHEQALIKLVLPSDSSATGAAIVRRVGTFFAQAITPIEKTHRTAVEADLRLDQLTRILRQRSADLAASQRQLKEQIEQRRLAEEALRKGEQHYGQLLRQSQQMQEQLRLLSHELLSAQEQERKRISRELHDVIAQTLTGINVRLAKLKNEAATNTKGIERNIARTQQLVEHSVRIVHRFARELRPTVLDDLGLVPALRTFMKNFQSETGIRVSLSAFAAVGQLNSDERTALFRVTQEAFTNVARHAQANQVEVKIRKLDGALCMTITDNGKGFQKHRVLHSKKRNRLGLLGMKERLEMVGGNFTITSTPGKGTAVVAQIPLIDRKTGGGEVTLIEGNKTHID